MGKGPTKIQAREGAAKQALEVEMSPISLAQWSHWLPSITVENGFPNLKYELLSVKGFTLSFYSFSLFLPECHGLYIAGAAEFDLLMDFKFLISDIS